MNVVPIYEVDPKSIVSFGNRGKRELDFVVAEYVMGWRWWTFHVYERPDGDRRGCSQQVLRASLHRPDFPDERWKDYAAAGNVLRLSEPGDQMAQSNAMAMVPQFSSTVDGDYEVLGVVRTWPEERQQLFLKSLRRRCRVKAADEPALAILQRYKPGYYARSALDVIAKQREQST